MSRYRRNRGGDPVANTASALSTPVRIDSDRAIREKHRQDAMDRLTGGCQETEPTGRGRPHHRIQESGRDPGTKKSSPDKSTGEDVRRSWTEKITLSRSHGAAKAVVPAPVPGMDSPVFAMNSGERRVCVQYKASSIILPITSAIRCQDLLLLAARYFTDVDPATFLLAESFTSGSIGLERPLRRYEYIRDVMNSWSYDSENFLLVIPPTSADVLKPLDVHNVPEEKPEDITFHLYHSHRLRRWDKRYVTLRMDGQVTVSKSQAKGHTNICHISDFDIYSPTERTLLEVRPPKKICYAIKSQQKSTLFMSPDKFMHFFSTDDRRVAEDWYRAVQSWRSWYLAYALGAGEKQVDTICGSEVSNAKVYSNRNSVGHGSGSEFPPHPQYLTHESGELKDVRGRGSPVAFPKKLTLDTDVNTSGYLSTDDRSPFSPAGLLGHTYNIRQHDMLVREKEKRKEEGLWNSQGLVSSLAGCRGPNTATSQPGSRSNTMKSTQCADAIVPNRSNSVTARPHKPLVDLTPSFQEPPQHRSKGRRVAVEQGVPLIEAATSPSVATGATAVPPATTWRRPSPPDEVASAASAAQSRTRYRANTARSAAVTHHQARATHKHGTAPTSPADEPGSSIEGPFIPNSLLAQSASMARERATRGIATAIPTVLMASTAAADDRQVTRPMLDLTENNPFSQGSMLANL